LGIISGTGCVKFCCPKVLERLQEDHKLATEIWEYVESSRKSFVVNKMTEKVDGEVHLDKLGRNHLVNSILNRSRFIYTTKDLLRYFAFCVCCRKRESLNGIQMYAPQVRLLQGEEKLMRELDVVKLLRAIRDVKLLKEC
jgi:hypothetical protein